MSEFFEYKFLAMEYFYKYVCEEEFTYIQAAARCFVDFTLLLSENTVKSLAFYSTVLVQVTRYMKEDIRQEVKQLFKIEYKRLIELYTFTLLKNLLSENERDYIDDDIDFIKYKLEYF